MSLLQPIPFLKKFGMIHKYRFDQDFYEKLELFCIMLSRDLIDNNIMSLIVDVHNYLMIEDEHSLYFLIYLILLFSKLKIPHYWNYVYVIYKTDLYQLKNLYRHLYIQWTRTKNSSFYDPSIFQWTPYEIRYSKISIFLPIFIETLDRVFFSSYSVLKYFFIDHLCSYFV